MQHDLFGRLAYDSDEEAWRGYRRLPHLAALAVRRGEEAEELDEKARVIQHALELQQAAGRLDVEQFFHAIQEKITRGELGQKEAYEADTFYSAAEYAAWDRSDARLAADACAVRQGLLPFFIKAPKRVAPTPPQEAAFRHLIDNEQAVAGAVTDALLHMVREYYSEDLADIEAHDLTSAGRLLNFDVTREHQSGISYLLFVVDADWEEEHGTYVVYHRDKGAEATTYDGLYDLMESDEPVESDVPPAPNEEVVEAAVAGDMDRARALIAQGHDINAVGEEDPYPPLCMAVEQTDVELVKRLLALGADPNLRDYEGMTALQRARGELENLSGRREGLATRFFMAFARMINRKVVAEMERRLQEIVRLLRAAGAR